MKTKFEQSWQIFKASIAATLRYPKLLWFPVLTTVLTCFIALFFFSALMLPVALHHTGYQMSQRQHWEALEEYYLPTPVTPTPGHVSPVRATDVLKVLVTGQPVGSGQPGPAGVAPESLGRSLILLVIYFVSMFLATFFNVAFYSEIMAALNGQGVSLRRGLSTAWSRLPSIFAWSLLAGVVGWAIRSIEQRLPFGARLVTGLIGIGWSVAAVFAIPVIVREQPMRNPIRILKQSALTLKRTWGEGLIGFVGFTGARLIMFGCLLVPLLAVGGLAILSKNTFLIPVVFGVWMVCVVAVAYVSNVARNVFRCALYLYAVEGVVPEPYSQELLDGAWKVKN
jgi:hypothetical protein